MTTRSSGSKDKAPAAKTTKAAKTTTTRKSTKAKAEAPAAGEELEPVAEVEAPPVEAANLEPEIMEPEEFVPEPVAASEASLAEFTLEQIADHVLRAVVSNQEALSIVRQDLPDKVRIAIAVGPEDLGKVIGKQGRTINALRAVVKTAAARTETQVVVDLEGKAV